MCGIAGIWRKHNLSELKSDIKKMTDSIIHRGPDGEGHWVDENLGIAFGHRRLSIIDLSENGKQPMHFLDRYVVTFNGEIYNYLELKEQLEKEGISFQSKSDTEILLGAYHFFGEKCVQYLDGMFAFSIYDKITKRFFCARDRFGEKPFYYFKDKEKFIFGSEMKALHKVGIPKNVSEKMIFNYLAYDVIENPHDKSETFFKNIFQLPGAHFLTFDTETNKFDIQKYWDINPNVCSEITQNEAIEKFTQLFFDSIKIRMRSDVKVGSSLSGGVDSSSILATIKNIYPNSIFNTFTARFDDSRFDEGKFIDILNEKYSFEKSFCYPKGNQIINDLDKIFYHQEEPFGSTSIIAQWEVMKLAKLKEVTVLLDGQGADETLAGYFKYFKPFLHQLYKSNRKDFRIQLNSIQEHLQEDKYLSKSFFLKANIPFVFNQVGKLARPWRMKYIANDLSSEFLNGHLKLPSPFKHFSDLNPFLYFDTFNYGLGKLLRFSDRNAMAHSREVRLPYLSHHLVEFIYSLPANLKIKDGWTKYILRKSMENIVPKKIIYRKDKKGFQPPDSWLKEKRVIDLVGDSIQLLKNNKIINTPNPNNNWKYIMCSKLLSNIN